MTLTALWFLETAGIGSVTLGQESIAGTLSYTTPIAGSVADDRVSGTVAAAEALQGALPAPTTIAGQVADIDTIEGSVS